MKQLQSRVTSLLLALVMVFTMIPAPALAAGVSESLVTNLASVYDGDEDRAREELGALYEAGIIDASGNLAQLDVREDGASVELSEAARRIANGETVGALTVNGHDATAEQIVQIQQVKGLLEAIRLMDEDVEITDEHIENLQALLQGIADGSVDLNNAIESGELRLGASRSVRLFESAQSNGLPATATGSGTVDVTDGKYTDHYISDSAYEESHAFELIDPTNTTWYSDSTTDGLGLDGVVTLSCADTAAQGGEVTVTATLNKAQPVEVSFDWRAWGAGVDASGTVTWNAGESDERTVKFTVPTGTGLWEGGRAVAFTAGNLRNALMADGKRVWNHTLTVTRNDHTTLTQDTNVYAWVTTLNQSSGMPGGSNQDWNIIQDFALPHQFQGDKAKLTFNYKSVINGSSWDTYNIHYYLSDSASFNYSSMTKLRGDVKTNTYTETVECAVNGEKYVHLDLERASDETKSTLTWNSLKIEERVPPQSVRIESVSVPAGTYYSGQIVPVTVNASNYIAPAEGTKLTVNGVSCGLLDVDLRESKTLTFGYTVQANDTGAINVTGLTGGLKNYGGKSVTIEGSFPSMSFGTDQGVTLVSDVKTTTLDLDGINYGLSDADAGDQLVTVLVPFAENAAKDWATNEAVQINADGSAIDLPVPGYSDGTATHYLAGAYFSNDGGVTRYPVYLVNSGVADAVALAARFAPPSNESAYLRKDTLDLFMDTQIVNAATDAAKYLPAWGDMKTDAKGFAYADSGWQGDAPALVGASRSYYVKGGVFFEKDAFTTRAVTAPDAENGFIKTGDDTYVLVQDADHPENQFDVEITANTAFFNAVKNGGRTEDASILTLRYQFSNRKNFTFTAPKHFTWTSSDETVATVVTNEETGEGQIALTGAGGEVTITLTVGNGSASKAYTLATPSITVLEGKTPFLSIPEMSKTRTTLTNTDTDVLFASNVTARNAAANQQATTFTAKLYKGDVVTGDPAWSGSFDSTLENTVTHITVPGGQITEPGTYTVVISAEYAGGAVGGGNTDRMALSATAYLNVKQAPVKVTLSTPPNGYSVTSDKIPSSLGYTLTSATADVRVEYTIQKSGEAVGERKTASGGSIPFSAGKPTTLKESYTVTLYARNNNSEPWSVDSMLLTVYNNEILDILVKDVVAGEIGGTTGGKGNGVKGTTVAMDNRDKVNDYLTSSDYQLTFDDFNTLRTDMSLQKVISANYGTGVWGLLSDKMQWASSDPATVSVDYKQGGIYSDIRNYSYVSYAPATDFLLVGKDDTAEGQKVTITATHAATGMSASFNVTATTLTDQLYVFQFYPKTTTTVTYTTYTNGKDETRELTSNANGELAVYEPNGIKGAVMATSTQGGDTYVGTIYPSELESGERDVASLQLYPCNNLRLRAIANAALTILKPDGTPYSGSVTVRAGVYKNGIYCPDALVKTAKGAASGQNGREDVSATASNGKLNLWFDPLQFNVKTEDGMETGGLKVGDTVTYVIEYRVAGYMPCYVILNAYSDLEGAAKPTDSVIQLRSNTGDAKLPQITRQTLQQYSGDVPTNYTRDVTDYTEDVGISTHFNKAELTTDVAFPGAKVETDEESGYATCSDESIPAFAIYTTGGKKLTGQTGGSGTEVLQIVDLKDLTKETTLYVFPFSSTAMARSVYTLTDADMTKDGITDQGSGAAWSTRVRMLFTNGSLTVKNEALPFGVSNLSHQADLGEADGASEQLGQQIKHDIQSQVDIGAIFEQINVNDMIRKGFVFLQQMSGAAGDNMLNMLILPTEDPASFRIMVFIGYNQREGVNTASSGNLSVNYDPEQLYDDAQKFEKALEDMSKDDDDDGGGEGSLKFNFYGTLLLDARLGIAGGDWDISFAGGNVGTNFMAGYEWSQTFMCGPVPVLISLEAGFNADLEVAFCQRNQAKAMLLDAAAGISLEAFAGLGFDLSLVAFKLGIFGKIGADVNFLYLLPEDKTGTKLDIDGEIGLKMEAKLLFITYKETFCSTGFGWTKKWGRYNDIQRAWENGEPLEITGLTTSGRAFSMRLFGNGTALVEIDSGGEIENRDYLELADRTWNNGTPSGRRMLMAASPMTNALLTDVQTNAYPYANPVLTDDGSMFLYISDNDNADELQSVVSYAVKSGNSYTNKGALGDITTDSNRDGTPDYIFADSDVVASGTGNNIFAAWVKQQETPTMELLGKTMGEVATYDDLGMMMNATEIYAGAYKDNAWTTTRLTDNTVADMAPTVASNAGGKAIVAWRSMSATKMPAEDSEQDLTAMFNAENNIDYRIYDGTTWTDAKVAYNGAAGTVNAIDSAMLSDGTALLTYTVRTGSDVTSTETFYTVIGADGNVLTTGRLTNDSYTDTNAQVTAVGNQFVLGWYSEHDAGVTESLNGEPVVAHDIRLARVNANGSMDADFPESVGDAGSVDIGSDFHFSAPAGNTSLENLSIVWSQPKNSDKAEDAGKYEINAVRFYQTTGENSVIGVTTPTGIAETGNNFTVDHFDTYTDESGTVHVLVLGSDYNSLDGIKTFDTINLEEGLTVLEGDNDGKESSSTLKILEQDPFAYMKLGSGTFPASAIEVTADTNLRELVPGLNLPVQFTVKNTGASSIKDVTIKLGSISKTVEGISLLPNQSTIITAVYPVPEDKVQDVGYTVTANGVEETGTLVLNRPDVGVSGMKLLREQNGERIVQVTLQNASGIPLAGSGKTVKLGLYTTADHEEANRVGNILTIADANALADIDEGFYGAVQTLKVENLIGGANEIPDEGIRLYAYAWVEDCDELYAKNNDGLLAFKGLLTKNNGETITVDTSIEAKTENETTVYTVHADIRNNSLQEQTLGIPLIVLQDSAGKALAQKILLTDPLVLGTEEKRSDLSVTFTADELNNEAPAKAVMGYSYKVSFDTNGGTGTFDDLYTDMDGRLTLPTAKPTPPTADPELVFVGWYTQKTGGERITDETVFTESTTVYAQYVTHQHVFNYSASGDTITATCTAENCPLPVVEEKHVATLTIVAPTLTKYGETGKSAEATFTGGIDRVENPAVEYWKDNQKLDAAPTDAGDYKARITLGEGNAAVTAKVDYTIAKRAVTLTSADASKAYDGTALTNNTVTVGGDGWATDDGATYTVTGSQTQPGNSKNAFTYTLNDGTKAGNYDITQVEGTLTITGRNDTDPDKKYEITVKAKSDTVTYDGQEHTVSGFETLEFVENGVTYTVSGLSASVSGTDAGTYTSEVTGTAVVKDANGNDLTAQFIVNTTDGTLTINKRKVTLTSATDSKEYDGTALTNSEVTVTAGDGWADGEGATYTVTGSQTVVGFSDNAFTYHLNENTSESNYIITSNFGSLTVNSRDTKYSVTLTANSATFTYDGQEKTVSGYTADNNSYYIDSDTVAFLAENSLWYSITGIGAEGRRTAAGSDSINITGTPIVKDGTGTDVTGEFAFRQESGTLTVDKRTVTLTSADDTKAYDGTALTNHRVTVSGDGWADGEGAAYDVTGTRTLPGQAENAFTYDLNAGTDGDNYDITKVEGTLTITNRTDDGEDRKYEITVTSNSGTVTYDGQEHTVSGFENLEFTFDGVKYTVSGLTAAATETNAGTYPVAITGAAVVKDAAGNDLTAQFTVKTVNGSLTINQIEISGAIVSMDAFAYGEATSTPGIVTDGKDGSNGTLVGSDPTKQVTCYYQSTAFLKSQAEDISTLGPTEGVYAAITPTTFDAGTHYVLAVVTGGNYNNVPYITQSVFQVTKNTNTVRTAPTAPTVDGTTITVAAADRSKTLEYSMDGQTWLPVTLDENGQFTVEWPNAVENAALQLREAADENYAQPSASAQGSQTITTTTFTVTYDANGGINAPEAATVTKDRTVTVSGQRGMTRKGYSFTGWNTAEDGSGTAYASGSTVNTGLTLYAQWKASTYAVSFNANGGTGTMATMRFTYDEAQTLTENAFTRTEYNFLGWSKSSSGGVQYQDKQSVKNVAESGTCTLYAVWAKDLYNVNGSVQSAETGKIDIELVQGNNSFGNSTEVTYDTANASVPFTVYGVPAGTYNLIAKQGDKTKTVAVIITDDHVPLEPITMPVGDTSSVLVVNGSETPAVVVSGLDKLAANEEIEARSVTVTMTVEAQDAGETAEAAEAAEKIQEVATSGSSFAYLNITIEKEIYNDDGNLESREKITETGNVLEFVIPFDFTGKSTVKIYRHHDGVTKALTETDTRAEETDTPAEGTYRLDRTNGRIYVYASNFSTYAIGYTTPSYYGGGGGGNGGGSSNGGGTTTYAVEVKTAAHGTVKASSSSAASGTRITLTATPDSGYQLDSIAVTGSSGREITLTRNSDGTYRFTMPSGKVTVTAVFAATEETAPVPTMQPDYQACPKDETCPMNSYTDLDPDAWYHDGVHYVLDSGIMNGVGNGKFEPSAATSRAMIVTMLWRMEGEPAVNYAMTFGDAESGVWYTEAIRWAASEGIVNGYSDTQFAPNDAVTREQMAAILYRYAQYKGVDVTKTSGSLAEFTDAASISDWAQEAMSWSVGAGLVSGMGDGTVSPKTDTTRAQVATLLMRYHEFVA